MAIHLDIEVGDNELRLFLTEDSGRSQVATVPRYPHPGSEQYVKMIDALDVLMYTWDDARGLDRGKELTR